MLKSCALTALAIALLSSPSSCSFPEEHHNNGVIHKLKQNIINVQVNVNIPSTHHYQSNHQKPEWLSEEQENESNIDEAEFNAEEHPASHTVEHASHTVHKPVKEPVKPVSRPVVKPSPSSAVAKGVDFAQFGHNVNPATEAKELKQAGITYVGRYISGANKLKDISIKEAQALHAEGIKIVLAAESVDGKDYRQGFNGGVNQAKHVLAEAERLDIPSNTVFYFSIDWDAETKDLPNVDAYLRGAASIVGLQRTGVYGGYTVGNYAVSKGLVANLGSCHAVWQSGSWTLGKTVPGVAFQQSISDKDKIDGAVVDYDFAECAAIGAW